MTTAMVPRILNFFPIEMPAAMTALVQVLEPYSTFDLPWHSTTPRTPDRLSLEDKTSTLGPTLESLPPRAYPREPVFGSL